MFNKLKKYWTAKYLASLTLLLLVVGLVSWWPTAAQAQAAVAAVGLIVGGLAGLIIYALGGLSLVVLAVLKEVAGYNTFINSQAVIIGWVVMRDIANMFFILVLLLIAFATILRVESYNYKRLLPKVLLLAILVNFSRSLCGIAIDLSQIVTLTFYNGFKDTGPGNFINVTGLPNWLDFAKAETYTANPSDPPTITGVIGSYFAAIVYAAIMLVVLVIITLVFTFRIIMLWLLTILSPMFFILMAFPAGQSYAKQWSSQFAKYLIVGPVITFFVWLSLAVFGTIDASTDFAGTSADKNPATTTTASVQPAVGPANAGTTGQMVRFIIAIGLLVGGLSMTSQLGVAGGKMAGAALSKMQSLGSKAALLPFKPLGYAASGLGEAAYNRASRMMLGNKVTRVLTPSFWKGVGALGKERTKIAQEGAESYGREAFETAIQTLKGGGAEGITPWVEIAERQTEQAHISKFKKELGPGAVTPEKISELMARMYNRKGEDADEMRRAVIQLAGQEGYIDDAIGQFIKDGVINKDNAAEWGMNVNDQGEVMVDNDAYRTFAAHYLGMNVSGEKGGKGIDAGTIANRMWQERGFKGGTQEALEALEDPDDDRVKKDDWDAVSKAARDERNSNMDAITGDKQAHLQNALRALADVGESGKTIGHWENMMVQQDSKRGYYLMDSDESFGRVSAEANKMDQQKFWQQLASHPTVAFTAKLGDANGVGANFDRDTTGYTNRFGRRFSRELMNESRISEKHRGQPRVNHDRLRTTLRYDIDKSNPWIAAADIKAEDGSMRYRKGDFLSDEAYDNFQTMMKNGTPAEVQAAYKLAMFSKQDKGIAPRVGESKDSFQRRLDDYRVTDKTSRLSDKDRGMEIDNRRKALAEAIVNEEREVADQLKAEIEILEKHATTSGPVEVKSATIDNMKVNADVDAVMPDVSAEVTARIEATLNGLQGGGDDATLKNMADSLKKDIQVVIDKLPEQTRQQLQTELGSIKGTLREQTTQLQNYMLKNFKYFAKK